MTRDWDRLAPVYRLQETLERPSLDAVVAHADPGPDDVVVALGCGPGTLGRTLGRHGRHVERLVGVDDSTAMLDRAAAAGMEVLRADVTAVPLDDDVADLVVAAWVLHLLTVPQRRAALAEAARLVRPTGRVAVVVPARPRGHVGRAVRAALRTVAGSTLSVPTDLDTALADTGLGVAVDHVVGGGRWGWVARVVVATPRQRSPQP